MVKLVNRAKMSTATTGSGTITLGSAESGYQSFADAGVVDGDTVRYVIEDGTSWEIGTGTYTASGTTLSRTVLESSNADAAINLSGSATVFVGAVAEDIPAVTKGTLTKSFASGETSTITLSQAITAGSPIVSVTKEVSQIGVTENAWNVRTTGVNYLRHDTAYDTTLTPGLVGFTDIDGSSYESVSFSVASQDTIPRSMAFNSDGTKMYIAGDSNNSIFQYSLSTGFDLTTASYDSVSFSVASQDISPFSIAFNTDGTKMYIAGDSNNSIFQYSLATGFDLTTASYDSVSFSVASQDTTPADIVFNSNGTKMYIVGEVGRAVYQYTLSTGFDLTTASYDSVSFTFSSQDIGSSAVAFNTDGTKLYMLGKSNRRVYQYSLATGFDLSTISYDSVFFSVASQDGTPIDIAFSSDGTKMYMFGYVNKTVYQYAVPSAETLVLGAGSFASADVGKTIEGNGGEAILTAIDGSYSLVTAFNDSSTIAAGGWSMYAAVFDATKGLELSRSADPYNLAVASYDSVSFSVTSQDSNPYGLAFNSDGTKMYVLGLANRSIFQYSLSTGFDLTTASYDSVSFSVTSQDSNPYSLAFNSDGTKMYVLGAANRSIFQYSLSTGFDLTTASYDSVSFSVASQDFSPYSIAFNTDGTKLYMLGNSSDRVYQYSLATGFDLSTISYDSVFFSVASQESGSYGLAFSSDGTKMFIVGFGDTVYQYRLAIGFDLTTASYDSVSFSVASQETSPFSVAFNTDGTKMYIVGTDSRTVHQYTTVALTHPTDQYAPAITNALGQVDSTYWTDVNSMIADQIAGDGAVYYAVSTDGRATWSVIDNTNGIRLIARDNAGVWEYNSDVTYSSTTWTSAAINAELDALQEALSVTSNRMDKTQLEAVTDANHYALGNSLDLMIALYLGSESASGPSSSGVSINYDANVKNEGAVLGVDYDWDFPSTDVVRITSNATQNLKVRIV